MFGSGYLNLLRNTGKMFKGSLITHGMFRAGYNLFPFKICPQESPDIDTGTLNTGVLDLHLAFTAATPANLDLFVLAIFNDQICIDEGRNVRIGSQ